MLKPGSSSFRNSLFFAIALSAHPTTHAQDAAHDGWNAVLAGDCAKAIRVLEPLANGKSSIGLKLVGDMYFYGKCKPLEPSKAISLYRESASMGLAMAQYNLGIAYQRGDHLAENSAEAARWFEKAVAQGYAGAQSSLGVMLITGRGVPTDIARGVVLIEKAALQGNAMAQDNLGKIYREGVGKTVDRTKAVYWYRKAAEQGLANGLVNFGLMTEMGMGTERNVGMAYLCYLLASKQGENKMQERMNQLKPQLSEHQLSVAAAFAGTWRPGQALPASFPFQ